MLSVSIYAFMLIVIMLNAVMVSVVAPFFLPPSPDFFFVVASVCRQIADVVFVEGVRLLLLVLLVRRLLRFRRRRRLGSDVTKHFMAIIYKCS
jgi:hypothetical protein